MDRGFCEEQHRASPAAIEVQAEYGTPHSVGMGPGASPQGVDGEGRVEGLARREAVRS